MNTAAHLLGIASLALIYWIGAWTWGQSPRIAAALRREPIPPHESVPILVRRRAGAASPLFVAPSDPTGTPAHDAGCIGARIGRA